MERNRITVINASFFGEERDIKRIVDQPTFSNVEYKLFTNKPEFAEGTNWEVIHIDQKENLRLKAREVKTHIHEFSPDSDYWLWLDSNMKIEQDPNVLVEKYIDPHYIVAMSHPERYDYYQEAQICANWGKDDIQNIQNAINFYYQEGCMPVHLYETGCLLRKNNEIIRKFNEIWWGEIQRHSVRDQLSFPYSAWKLGLAVNTFPGTNSVNPMRYENKPHIPQWDEIVRDYN